MISRAYAARSPCAQQGVLKFARMRLSPIKLLFFAAAIGALVWGANTWRARMARMQSQSTEMAELDKWLVGTYVDLIRSQDVDKPASNDPSTVRFIVAPGASVTEIGQQLEVQGLVTDSDLFRSYVRINGIAPRIQAGNFTLRKNMSIKEVAVALQRAQFNEISITIPEGRRIEEVAELVEKQAGVSAAEFLRLVRLQLPDFNPDYPFLKGLPEGATLEGYLFPDTYRLPENPTAQDVILRMLDNFGEKAAPVLANAQGKTAHELLTVASIVEREAVIGDERPTIASLYLNRLNIGMPLQADPTVQYAMGYDTDQQKWWRQITQADYQFVDPAGYNTYRSPTLPPGPIASPGLGSIQAVVTPQQTNFIFMVACPNGDGRHAFSVTYEEQLANFAKCQ
jgi:UPF0755 protein